MADESTFGKPAEGLQELFSIGADGLTDEDKDNAPSLAALDLMIEKSGSEIGEYRLLRILGEGGMGIVYLAEQEQPIRRQVALKIIKPGMDSKRVTARFESERQALALLDHPNIARIFDAGTTESGRPYFVMEYVKGLPITKHCDEQKLSIEERLRLFQQICDAVHHAHQKGIIHRDIKPSNILVTLQDDRPVPKIIDFGIAKALSQPLTERTSATEESQLLGTPEYMSPEQADMATEDIDTRSDIYSLGVLLYVLLTGALPFDSGTLREGGLDHIRKIIRETDPKTPSTRLSSLGEEAKKVAQSRRTEITSLAKKLYKELEWIPLKAMRKERTERYRSASELADDIENYLKGEPLIAGPPGASYKLKKFVGRNRVLAISIGAVLTILVAGGTISTIFAIRAKRALERETRAHGEAQAVSDFLRLSVLESLDPYRVGGRQITIRTILDTASKDLQNEFHGAPMAEAEIRRTIGFAYWSLGFYEQHELHYRRAIEICRAKLGNEDPKTLLWVKELGWGYFARSQFKEAEKLFSEAYKGMQRELGEEDPNSLHAMASLGTVYYMQGRFQEAERLCRNALETNRFIRGEELDGIYCFMLAKGYHFQGFYEKAEQLFTRAIDNLHRRRSEKDWYTLTARLEYGELCRDLGRYKEAEYHLLKVLNDWRDAWGQEHPETLWTKSYLGWLYLNQGRYKKAEEMLFTTLKTARQGLGEIHLLNAHTMHGLGALYLSQEQFGEAEQFLTDASDILCHILGEENWPTLDAMSTLASLYVAQRRYTKAEDLYLKTLEVQRRVLGEKHLHTLRSMNGLALLYTQQAQYQMSESLLAKVLKVGRSVLGASHPQILTSMHDLAMLYEVQGLYDKAEPLLLEAVKGRRLKLGGTHPQTKESFNNLIELYETWNKPEKAQEWRARLTQNEDYEE